jgi:hypothetical protein
VQEVTQEHITEPMHEITPVHYYAQLIVFGTSGAAYKYADTLRHKNMPVSVKEFHSVTAQGKKIIWYQVVTELFDNEDELLMLVHRLKKEEKLHDIRIVQC